MFGCFGSATLFKSQKIVGESDLPRFFYGITGLSCGSEEKFTADSEAVTSMQQRGFLPLKSGDILSTDGETIWSAEAWYTMNAKPTNDAPPFWRGFFLKVDALLKRVHDAGGTPLRQQAIRDGRRVEAPRFGVDEAICTGDHACIRLSGCPSLSLKRLDDPLRDDPVASIDQSCVGCGNCGEVADAAVLCPSFYRADVVHNPTPRERRRASIRAGIIGWLQARRQARRLDFGGAA
jgi:hypothetical protein